MKRPSPWDDVLINNTALVLYLQLASKPSLYTVHSHIIASLLCTMIDMGKAKSNRRQSGCPVAFALDTFGDKWSILVVRDMLLNGKKYYGELLESPEHIASNILADRLKRLEEARVITKNPDPENQKKYVYELTQKGVDLLPLVLEAVIWGSKYISENSAPKGFLRRLKKDRDTVTQRILESLRRKESFIKVKGWTRRGSGGRSTK